uniref:C-C motif chemokine 20 n=1 Tax=Scatophagus argus TaxID=75038 RepID=UPI001ED80E67|nr:C-C motif chemokine 20 [Scatophagus argus]
MAKLTACVFLMLMVLTELTESSPFCCTQYQETPLPVQALKYYKIQRDTDYCNIKAVIFRTKRKRLVCANPDQEWVQKAMESVPEKH